MFGCEFVTRPTIWTSYLSSGVRGEDWMGVDVVEISASSHPTDKKTIDQLQGLCIKDEDSVNENWHSDASGKIYSVL